MSSTEKALVRQMDLVPEDHPSLAISAADEDRQIALTMMKYE